MISDNEHFVELMYKMIEKLGYNDIKKNDEEGIYTITAKKDGKTYLFACKYHIDAISGNDMQLFIDSAKKTKADLYVFMTNSSFSSSAKKLANAEGVELWDRNYIDRMMIGIDIEMEHPKVKKKNNTALFVVAGVVAVVLIAMVVLYFLQK